jgi:hypothetical protein
MEKICIYFFYEKKKYLILFFLFILKYIYFFEGIISINYRLIMEISDFEIFFNYLKKEYLDYIYYLISDVEKMEFIYFEFIWISYISFQTQY